ncbi:MAG: lysozyme inhibitor LprI family protein, partial [Alphaproteobacteria bacterium]
MGRLLPKLPFLACILAMHAPQGMVASFDCGKARRPIEKFICATPELDAADTRMGEAYRPVGASFPLKGFVLTTQREFLAGYSRCMSGTDNRPSTGPASARRRADAVQRRIAELVSC